MKRYQHFSSFGVSEEKALKRAKKNTGLSFNQLLTLCVRKARPTICADLGKDDQQVETDPDWNAFMDKPRRKVPRYWADEIRQRDRH